MKTKDKRTRGQEDKNADRPVTIVVTVLPPKKGIRKMLVSAAREGEMPLVLSGPFVERHHLLDQAYATCLRRGSQVVTVKEDKRKGGRVPAGQEEEPGNREPDGDGKMVAVADEAGHANIDTARQGDQLVSADVPVSSITETEELPTIEGDDVETLQAMSLQDDAELSDISLAEIPRSARNDTAGDGFPPEARGNDGIEARGNDGGNDEEVGDEPD